MIEWLLQPAPFVGVGVTMFWLGYRYGKSMSGPSDTEMVRNFVTQAVLLEAVAEVIQDKYDRETNQRIIDRANELANEEYDLPGDPNFKFAEDESLFTTDGEE